MPIETVVYISDLNIAYPEGGDQKKTIDDHMRNLKIGIKNTFPNISGAVTPTHTELNYVDGVTSAIQTQLDDKASLAQLAAVASGELALVLETGIAVTALTGTHHALTNVALSTVTLPSAPAAGFVTRVTAANGLATNVIARNGKNIMGLAEDLTIDRAYVSVALRYINTTIGWGLI